MQLFVHTEYSFYESNINIHKYLSDLSNIGQKYAAITDKNNIYGMWEFIKTAKQFSIIPIVGSHISPRLKCGVYSNGGFLIFLRSMEGFHSFNSIISSSTNKKQFNMVFENILSLGLNKKLQDIIFVSLSLNTYKILSNLLIPQQNLYFGLIEDIFIKKPFLHSSLINFFENFNFPNPIFLSKIFFNNPIEDQLIDLLATCRFNRLIKRKKEIYKKRKPIIESFHNICKFYYLVDTDKYAGHESKFPEGNPYNILSNKALSIIKKSIENAKNFPSFFSEIKPRPAVFPSFYIDADSQLKEICFAKLNEKKLDSNPDYIKRLKYELDIIFNKGFSNYFLFVYDIICYAKEKKIIYIGRGSAASSLVSYLLDITEVDPILLNLYFERFLNPQRESFPDIDIDFSWKERDGILYLLLKKYPFNCCMVSTTIRMNLKGAFRNSAKFYGMSPGLITKYSKLIPSFYYTKDKSKIKEILYQLGIPENIIELTTKVLNLPYAKGVHPGGVILSSPDILNSTPFLYAPKGVPISHFDLNDIEDSGLIKIDILSQRALQVFQDSIQSIKELYDKDFYLSFEIANSDSKTWERIRKGDCRGCFYIESSAMVNLIRELDVSNFSELVAASSVIRPGVSDSGMKDEYILRKKKIKKAEYELPILEEILNETFGIMIYQEDVLKVASSIGNLSLSQADLLRKAMSGKSRSKDEIKKLREKFIQGGLKQGYSLKNLDKIWFQIESFAGYAFCKAHSASYSVLSIKLAYIRTHFPEIFYAALLNNFGGYYPSIAYNILAIMENIKFSLCSLRNARKSTYFDKEKIIIGLDNLFFLCEKEKEIIINFSRNFIKDDKYILAKFISFSNMDRQKLIKLIQIGFFDDYYQSSFFSKALCEFLFAEKDRSINNLIDKESEFLKIKNFFTENILNLYYYRYKYLGIFVDLTPFQILQKLSDYGYLNNNEKEIFQNYKPVDDFIKIKNNRVDILGWLITYRSAATKDGKLMGFATFFDGKNFIETTLFPDIYKINYNLLKYFNFFQITLEIQKKYPISLLIQQLKPFVPDFFDRLKESNDGRDNKKTKTGS